MQRPCPLLAALLIFCGTLLAQTNPIPFVNQPLSPQSAAPGGGSFKLTVNGTGFVSGSVVKWNGSSRTTTFLSKSRLQATISAADIASPVSAAVTVSNPAPGGGTSNVANFEVTLPAPGMKFYRNSFGNGSNFAVSDLTTGDFNGDGNLDLAVSSNAPGKVIIFLGDGQGHLAKFGGVLVQVFAGPLVSGDFNGDSKPDLAVITDLNEISVLLGNGDGSFQPQQTTLTGMDPVALATGDFNQDGELDLAVSNNSDNSVSILLGHGDGSFTRSDVPTGGVSGAGLTVGDFNSDGRLDLAIAEYDSQQITILLGNGDGSFQFAEDIFALGYPTSVVAADLNGDRRLDLLVSNQDSRGSSWQALFAGNGDGSFSFQKNVGFTRQAEEQSAAVADMNADGLSDLVILRGKDCCNQIVVMFGDGTGKFQKVYELAAGADTLGLIPQKPVVGDFNHDGKLDAVTTGNNGYQLTVFSQGSIVLAPQKLDFGEVQVGHPSAPLRVTLTNAGVSALNILGFKFHGTYAADFSQTNDCPASLNPGASCTVQVIFNPSGPVRERARLQVSDDGPRGEQSETVKGAGYT